MRFKEITAAVTTLALGILAFAPAAQADISVSISGGNTMQVVGDDAANEITAYNEADPACPGGGHCYAVRATPTALTASAPCVLVHDPSPTAPGEDKALCPTSGLTELAIFGQGGADQIVTTVGESGASVQRTDLGGGGGDDEIFGSFTPDTIHGNSGRDRLFGEFGNDDLIGGSGDDVLKGSAGNDGMDGGRGRDDCNGGPGRDTPRHCERVKSVP